MTRLEQRGAVAFAVVIFIAVVIAVGAGSSEPRGCACPDARLAQAVAPSGAPHPRPCTGSSLSVRTCPVPMEVGGIPHNVQFKPQLT